MSACRLRKQRVSSRRFKPGRETFDPTIMDVAGRRITVMGLGRHGGGVGAARWLAEQGAVVTVTDLADADALANSIAALADVPIARWTLGRHDESDFTSADAIVVNPAVRPDNPLLAVARANGVQITSDIELFLERCPASVVAVTGSNGKSTTASMLARIFALAATRTLAGRQHRCQPAWPARSNPSRRPRGAGAEQLSARTFEFAGSFSRGCRHYQLHRQSYRLARFVWGLRGRQAAGHRHVANHWVCRHRSSDRPAGPIVDHGSNASATWHRPAGGADCRPLKLPGEHNRRDAGSLAAAAAEYWRHHNSDNLCGAPTVSADSRIAARIWAKSPVDGSWTIRNRRRPRRHSLLWRPAPAESGCCLEVRTKAATLARCWTMSFGERPVRRALVRSAIDCKPGLPSDPSPFLVAR